MKILQVKPAVRALITISRALDPLAPRGRRPKADRIIVTSSAKLLIANDPAELQGWGLAFFIFKKKRGKYTLSFSVNRSFLLSDSNGRNLQNTRPDEVAGI